MIESIKDNILKPINQLNQSQEINQSQELNSKLAT